MRRSRSSIPGWTEPFKIGLEGVTLSLGDMAAALGCSVALVELAKNRAIPSRALAVKFRRWLIQHSRDLQVLARQLPKEDRKR